MADNPQDNQTRYQRHNQQPLNDGWEYAQPSPSDTNIPQDSPSAPQEAESVERHATSSDQDAYQQRAERSHKAPRSAHASYASTPQAPVEPPSQNAGSNTYNAHPDAAPYPQHVKPQDPSKPNWGKMLNGVAKIAAAIVVGVVVYGAVTSFTPAFFHLPGFESIASTLYSVGSTILNSIVGAFANLQAFLHIAPTNAVASAQVTSVFSSISGWAAGLFAAKATITSLSNDMAAAATIANPTTAPHPPSTPLDVGDVSRIDPNTLHAAHLSSSKQSSLTTASADNNLDVLDLAEDAPRDHRHDHHHHDHRHEQRIRKIPQSSHMTLNRRRQAAQPQTFAQSVNTQTVENRLHDWQSRVHPNRSETAASTFTDAVDNSRANGPKTLGAA